MKGSDPDDSLALHVFAMQSVVVVLVICMLVFLGVGVFNRNGPNPPKAALNPPTLTLIGFGFAGPAVVLHFIIPPLFVAIARSQIANGTWNPSSPENPVPAGQLGVGWARSPGWVQFIFHP